MTWFKVDDQLAFHPKIIACTPTAIALWVRAGAWSAGHLTDGCLPAAMISPLGYRRRDAEKLVEVGLWEAHRDGYRFRNWDEYQPTKAQVEEEREQNKARQQAWRDRRRNSVRNGVTDGVTDGVTNSAPTRPVLNNYPPTPQGGPDRFDEFWAAYPRKTAKVSARKAWTKAVKSTDPQVILDGLARYRFSDDPQYIAHPATWLNGGRWADEPAAGSNGHGTLSPDTRPGPTTSDEWRAQKEAREAQERALADKLLARQVTR
jgi:hypothetical protein